MIYFSYYTVHKELKVKIFKKFIQTIKKYEDKFLPLIKQNDDPMFEWPVGYMNEVKVSFHNDVLNIQGKRCAVVLDSSIIKIFCQGCKLADIDIDIQKDDFFNCCVNDNLYGLEYDDIKYLQNLKDYMLMELINE